MLTCYIQANQIGAGHHGADYDANLPSLVRTGAESRKLAFAGGNDRLRASLLGPSHLLKT